MSTIPSRPLSADEMLRENMLAFIMRRDRIDKPRATVILNRMNYAEKTLLELALPRPRGMDSDYDPFR